MSRRMLLGLDRTRSSSWSRSWLLAAGLLGLLAVDWQYSLLFSTYDDTVTHRRCRGRRHHRVVAVGSPGHRRCAPRAASACAGLLAHLRREATSRRPGYLASRRAAGRLEVDGRHRRHRGRGRRARRPSPRACDATGTVRSGTAPTAARAARPWSTPTADVETLTEARRHHEVSTSLRQAFDRDDGGERRAAASAVSPPLARRRRGLHATVVRRPHEHQGTPTERNPHGNRRQGEERRPGPQGQGQGGRRRGQEQRQAQGRGQGRPGRGQASRGPGENVKDVFKG